MAEENQISIEVKLEDGSYRKAWVKLESDSKEAGEKSGSIFGLSYGNAIASAIAALGVKKIFSSIVKAATEQEDAINSFNSALRVTGQFTQQASAGFQEYAASLQRVTTVNDEVITQGGALLVTLGKLSGEGLERATKASLDLAAGLNIDVTSAFNLMSKAATGNVSVLSRYGLKVAETGNASEDFARAIQKINQEMGGLAASKVNTFSGALAQLNNNFGEILEGFGNFIIKSPQVVAVLKFVSGQFSALAESLSKRLSGGNPIDELTRSAAQFATVIVQYVMPPVEFLFNSLKTGTLAVAAGISGLITGVLFVAEGWAQLGGMVGLVSEGTVASIQQVRDASANLTADIATRMAESANEGFDFSATAATENFLIQLQSAVDRARPIIENGLSRPITEQLDGTFKYIVSGFKNTFSQAALTSQEFRDQLGKNVTSAFTTFRNGFTSTFAAMGKAWQEGTSVIGAFGKAVLGLFGDLALQIGQFYFLMGLGNLFIAPAVGAQQIAAGIALSVLGGVLKSMSGGGGSTAGAGAGAGGSSGGGGVAAPTADFAAQSAITDQRQEAQSRVVVNIQGNVLDRKGTGIEIAEIIRENFELAGVTTIGATA